MIKIKTQQEIELMRKAGKELARIFDLIFKQVEVGMSTKYLDKLAEDEIRKINGFPIFKGYHGFPTAVCTCINAEVVHAAAVPDRKLQDGDIFSLDIGMRLPAKNGMIVDMAKTIGIGKISSEAKKLIKITEQVLDLAIKKIKPGIYLGNISNFIQIYTEKNSFNVVREMVGHGVGRKLHEDPQIPNYGLPSTGPVLQTGMVLAIEPMTTAEHWKLEYKKENQAYKTADNSLSAHFEHTVLVTENGSEVLTR